MSHFLLARGLLHSPNLRIGATIQSVLTFETAIESPSLAVVRVDHEEILCNERLRIIETISPAFHELMEDMTRALQKKPEITS